MYSQLRINSYFTNAQKIDRSMTLSVLTVNAMLISKAVIEVKVHLIK